MSNLEKICLFCSVCVFVSCLIKPLLANSTNDLCGYLPKQCTTIEDKTQIVCGLNDGKVIFNTLEENNTDLTYLKSCNKKNLKLKGILFVNKPWFNYIIDRSFDFDNLFSFSVVLCMHLKMCNHNRFIQLDFSFLDGFELIDKSFSSTIKNNLNLMIRFYKCKFHFYLNENRRLEPCQDYLIHSNNLSSIVNMKQWEYFSMIDCKLDIEVCPLVFANANIIEFENHGMIKSFHKINVFKFSEISFPNLNSNIKRVSFYGLENIDLDSSILNKHVFQNIEKIWLIGHIKSIQVDIFKSFKKIKTLTIQIADIRRFFHSNSIEWIKNLNGEINVNLSNLTSMSKEDLAKNQFKFYVSSPIPIAATNLFDENMHYIQSTYPDEDFCLYRYFPFHKMILFYDKINEIFRLNERYTRTKITCTYLWLIQLYPIISK